ncbi:hypothetical protein [Levilactobacillus huananensis]|uniref:hypothetical protein n=1 Tax=Levilactobacillus huananensis TaxID=2486019 RepID=UPI000F7A09CD|nr:hypothetical protein [Levilactobacillus huananensis]
MKKECKEILEQQLQLLSDSSKKASPDELMELTNCMNRILQVLVDGDAKLNLKTQLCENDQQRIDMLESHI